MAKENAKKTELTIVSDNFTELNVLEALSVINEKLKNLQNPSQSEKTGGKIKLSKLIDIHTTTEVSELMMVADYVIAKRDARTKVNKELGVNVSLKIAGHSPSAWLTDIKARLDVITNQKQIDKLKEAKDQLEKLLSDEDKRKAVLANLKDLFTSEIEE